MIASQVLKERDGLIADHPTEAGYIHLYRAPHDGKTCL